MGKYKIELRKQEIYYLQQLWWGIKDRCYNLNNSGYKDYGERGIGISPEWKNNSEKFINYILRELGHRLPNYQLDRIDNNLGYEPGNIRWVSSKENARNRRSSKLITINDITKTAAAWSEEYNLNASIIHSRLKRGWAGEKLLIPSKFKIKNIIDDEKYLYKLWRSIKNRCYNSNSEDFKFYGAKGIVMSDQWKNSFINFKKYILENIDNRKNSTYQLDRIDTLKNYEENNLRWSTSKENNRNKRNNFKISINGIEKTLSEWSEISGLARSTIKYRIKINVKESDILKPIQNKFTQETIDQVKIEITAGKNLTYLSKKYKIGRRLMTDIARGRSIYEKK